MPYCDTGWLSWCTILPNTTFRSAGLAPQFAFVLREDVKPASATQPKQTYVLNIKKALMDVSVVALLLDPLPPRLPISALKLTILLLTVPCRLPVANRLPGAFNREPPAARSLVQGHARR